MLQRKTPLQSKTPMKKGAPLKRGKPMKSGGQLESRSNMKRTEMKRTAMKKTPRPKLTKIQRSAKGQDCTVRVPGVCNFNPETTVLGHLNGGGMSTKHNDVFAAYVCSDCHAWLDGGYVRTATRDERDLLHLQGVIKTQPILMELGLIIVAEAA